MEDADFNCDAYLEYFEKNMGITTVSQLGNGAYGCAFLTDTGKVLKITTDRSEAVAACILKDKNLPHVAEVYEVYECVEDYLYVIIKEFVPFHNELKEVFNEVRYSIPWSLDEEYIEEFRTEAPTKHNLHGESEIDIVNQIAEMLLDWKVTGFTSIDAHLGNIGMTDEGVVKLFDFGANGSKGDIKPQVINLDYATV